MTRPAADGLKLYLDALVHQYNRSSFIANDPICIPHSFNNPRDQEIAGFFAAIFSWGLRKTIITKSREFMHLMDDEPYNFVRFHKAKDRKAFKLFKHRTFNYLDAEFFLSALQGIYLQHESLEDFWFLNNKDHHDPNFIYNGVIALHLATFQNMPENFRSRKHLSSPEKNSTCKRLLMFLRWMVRHDDMGVDLGLWKRIPPSTLLIPLDLHVFNTAQRLGLCSQKRANWAAVLEITNHLRSLDATDPIKYDFALFSADVY